MPNELIKKLKEIEGQNHFIYDLTESNPTRCEFAYPKLEILESLYSGKNILYDPSPQGFLEARQAICDYYLAKNYNVNPDQVFITTSTSEGYSFLFRLLTNPGERILFPRPSYPLFEFLVDLNDIKMDTYPLVYDYNSKTEYPNWHIDLKALEDAITPATKAIVLVNPNNPTGSFIKKKELKAINDICKANNLVIIADEVFLDYCLEEEDQRVMSLVENKDVLTFTLSGISKIIGLPQMKISWIMVNGPEELKEMANERLEVIADTYLSVNTPCQNALKKWLSFQPEMRREILKRVRQNHQFLIETFKNITDCLYLNSNGGWYGIVKLPKTKSEEEWVFKFLNDERVFTHPGYFFDFEEEPFIVVSLLTPVTVFQEGIKRIVKQIKG